MPVALRPAVWCVVALALLLPAPSSTADQNSEAEEIPIERCDVLPVVKVRIDDHEMRLLVDTGATSILNINSFAAGTSKKIHVSSWNGTAATSAREVSVPDLVLGSHRLQNLKLPAIDLSPIGKACGGKIDGILGVDLLDKLGVTIDLKRQVARLEEPFLSLQARTSEMLMSMHHCTEAFVQGRAEELEDCFDPDIVLYSQHGEFHGRKEVMKYLKESYLKYAPKIQYQENLHEARSFGDALWYTYDYTLDIPGKRITGHGVAMCRRDHGPWRMLNMHNSQDQPEPAAAPK
jgi:predicted aspartyl protease